MGRVDRPRRRRDARRRRTGSRGTPADLRLWTHAVRGARGGPVRGPRARGREGSDGAIRADRRMRMEPTGLHIDGNGVAGTLQEIFTTEITVAERICQSCGTRAAIGAHRAYQ